MPEKFVEHEVTVTITISTHIDIEDWEEACEHLENDISENGIGNYNAEFQFDSEQRKEDRRKLRETKKKLKAKEWVKNYDNYWNGKR
tara:strand:- start:824 stop:1084 length:261 start_codon:yes stop_codon:yes gene_type:complete